MEWNYIFLWFAGSSCVLTLINSCRATPPLKGWIGVSAMILAAGGLLYYLRPEIAGFTAGSMWAVLVLTPALLQRRIARLTVSQRYSTAERLASVIRWLHPFDGVWQQARLLHALVLSERGDIDEATRLLEELRDHSSPRVARSAAANLARLSGNWPRLIELVQSKFSNRTLRRDPNLLAVYLRALGETGQLNEMLLTLDRYRPALDSPMFNIARHVCRMQAFAFAGDIERIEYAFGGPLRVLPPVVQQFWIATAEMAAGQLESGRGRLLTIEDAATPGTRRAISRRLDNPPPLAGSVLSPEGVDVLHRLDLDRDHEERYATTRTLGRRAWVTYGILLANVAMFAAQWFLGGTMNEDALARLGAFHPAALGEGQYWRLLAANFLHYGPAHIALNMLALVVLGPFVEFAIGGGWYLAVYLVSGVCAISTVWVLQLLHLMQPEWLVGASGAIMGLIGANAAIQLRGWRRERARIASRRLRTLLFIVALQATFDMITPQVSGTAHLAGAIWGFVLTSLVPHRTGRQPRGFPILGNSTP